MVHFFFHSEECSLFQSSISNKIRCCLRFPENFVVGVCGSINAFLVFPVRPNFFIKFLSFFGFFGQQITELSPPALCSCIATTGTIKGKPGQTCQCHRVVVARRHTGDRRRVVPRGDHGGEERDGSHCRAADAELAALVGPGGARHPAFTPSADPDGLCA